jgi:hypothetical protein
MRDVRPEAAAFEIRAASSFLHVVVGFAYQELHVFGLYSSALAIRGC